MNPIDIAIVRGGSEWANKSSADTIMSFVNAGFGYITTPYGELVEKITPTSYGNYYFIRNEEK